MKLRVCFTAILVGAFPSVGIAAAAQSDAYRAPGFHHLHLNSVDPEAAIDFYVRHFSNSRTTWGGMPALMTSKPIREGRGQSSPPNALILFNKVNDPPPADPYATAYWSFGWSVKDVRGRLQPYAPQPEVKALPQYFSDGYVVFVSDGYGYLQGPDNALVELGGRSSNLGEFFHRIRMFHDKPVCARFWYRRHLNAPTSPQANVPENYVSVPERECAAAQRPAAPRWPALQRDGLLGGFHAYSSFSDVTVVMYFREGSEPLQSSRAHVIDHMALSVSNLDAWIAKLKSEGVTFLEEQYRLGDTRAVMIEGPSREAIELVEVPQEGLPSPGHTAPGFFTGTVQ
jgi:hypothetical protein